MKVLTVVGTRPEFIQMKSLSRAIRTQGHTEVLVHTGQHYDLNMSDVFFRDLQLPTPDFHLGVGSKSHAEQTGQIMIHLETLIQAQQPDWVLVYGDTNSTVAAGLAAAKLNVPVAHVEAGLRSFDRTMPEEINRIVVDHVSKVLLSPTEIAVKNLAREGIDRNVFLVGDIRVDLLHDVQSEQIEQLGSLQNEIRNQYGTTFALATIHRVANTDERARLAGLVETLNMLSIPVVIPVHPRLEKMLRQFQLSFSDNVCTIEPVGFLEMVALLNTAQIVITDSGGLQKEAYMLRRPSITVRDTTEWVETVEAGWNRLCSPDRYSLSKALEEALAPAPAAHPDYYGTYGVGKRIVAVLEQNAQPATSAQPEPIPTSRLQTGTLNYAQAFSRHSSV